MALSFVVNHQAAGGAQSALNANAVGLVLTLAVLWVTGLGLLSRKAPDITTTVSGILLGILYVSYLASYLVALRGLPNGANLVSLAFIVTWASDAGVYLIGSMIPKRHALVPSISPRKTIEGAIAGLFFALAFALLSRQVLFPQENVLHFVVIGVMLGVLGQVGDLVESAFKRAAGVKDAGKLLPLQGGILDRIDGLLFTAPALYYYLRLVILH